MFPHMTSETASHIAVSLAIFAVFTIVLVVRAVYKQIYLVAL